MTSFTTFSPALRLPWWQHEVYLLPGKDVTLVGAAEGPVWQVPTRVLVERPSGRAIAFGPEARTVEHAGVGRGEVVTPFGETALFEEETSVQLLRALFRQALGSRFLLKPRVVLAESEGVTPFMQELWQRALFAAGARERLSVHPLLALAAGAELPFRESHGYAVAMISSEQVQWGLVAFGHVQFGWEEPGWLSDVAEGKNWDDTVMGRRLALSWQKFVQHLPPEYALSVQQEGVIIAIDESHPQTASKWSHILDTPVVVVPRTTVVLGLRRWQELQQEVL